MKFSAFAYARPASVHEAVALLAEDEDARPIAGGQSLLPVMALRLAAPATLVDLGGIGELTGISYDAACGLLRIGAMSTHAANAASDLVADHAPLMAQALRHVAHEAVRNRGTLGGSIVNADAGAEMPLVVSALDADLVLRSVRGERTVNAADFFVGHYTTALQPGELLVRVEIPAAPARWAFEEVARRPGDFALAMVAVGLEIDAGRCRAVRMFMGSIADRPLRAAAAESYLAGRLLDQAALDEAVRLATDGLSGRSDIHASAATRLELTRNLLARALQRAANGGA